MKSEHEVKQMFEDLMECYNDKGERYRIYGQAITMQHLDTLEWVLGWKHENCWRRDWGPEEALKKYKAIKRKSKKRVV